MVPRPRHRGISLCPPPSRQGGERHLECPGGSRALQWGPGAAVPRVPGGGPGALCQQHPRSQSRALSWVRAWIHAVPPQGAPLEEEDVGGTASVSPPALSLGHSSSQEEGSGLPWWLVAEIPPSNAGG